MNMADLCSGYGGLALALEPLGCEPALFAEIDKDACAILAAHWPDVPNVDDLTTVDWTPWAGRVDALSAGYPCQPFSTAGARKGTDDPRHLWPSVARAIRELRPRLVVLENVRGHLSLGFLRVLGDLAELGFDAEWRVVGARDIGACHRRERVFVVAYARGTRGWEVARGAHGDEGADAGRGAHRTDRPAGGVADGAGPLNLLPTPTSQDASGSRSMTAVRSHILPTTHIGTTVADWAWLRAGITQDALLPTPRTSDANGAGSHGTGGDDLRTTVADGSRWGRFAAAIARHESVLGRPAPDPLVGKSLSPAFVEWMMMLPEGWVTGCGLSRTAQLRALGNGVVPPQALAAVVALCGRVAA